MDKSVRIIKIPMAATTVTWPCSNIVNNNIDSTRLSPVARRTEVENSRKESQKVEYPGSRQAAFVDNPRDDRSQQHRSRCRHERQDNAVFHGIPKRPKSVEIAIVF